MTALFDEPVRAHADLGAGEEPVLWVGVLDDADKVLVITHDGSIEITGRDFVKADWRWDGKKWFDLESGSTLDSQTNAEIEPD